VSYKGHITARCKPGSGLSVLDAHFFDSDLDLVDELNCLCLFHHGDNEVFLGHFDDLLDRCLLSFALLADFFELC